jgi:DNA-binding response OmpR family regulator
MNKALVVDDDTQILTYIKQVLEAAGHDVVTSNNFKDARELIQRHTPAIVVADVRLGDFNGIQLAILARSARPDVRVVIISGWDDTVLRHEAAELGAVYLQKPFGPSELLAALN